MHERLAQFQIVGARWLASNKHAILADLMGIGKSAQAINAWQLTGAKKILVVCPGIARDNWLREINMWSVIPRTCSAIYSSKNVKRTDVMVVSYSLLRSVTVLRKLIEWGPWDCLVLDEAQNAKNDSAWRTKAIYGVDCDGKFGLAAVSKAVWLLSGTIMPRHPGELWPHCHALFPDVAQGMGYHRWVNEYCVEIPGTDRVVGVKNADKLVSLLKPHVMRRGMEVMPEMPSLRLTHVPIRPEKIPPMPSDVSETAEVLRLAMKAMREREVEKGQKMLRDLGDMALATLRKWTGVALAPAVADYINMDFESGMDKVVIFAEHRDVIDTLQTRIPGSVSIHGGTPSRQRQIILDAFQGKIPGNNPSTLIGNVTMLSTAIPLTASAHAVFAEAPWVPATIEQAIKRVHRQGQTRAVLARVFSLQGSVHEIVMGVLTKRAREIMRLTDSLVTR